MALTKRSTKGSALTHTEMDANLTHLGGDGTYVMPTSDGDSGQVMSTNGEGQVSWAAFGAGRVLVGIDSSDTDFDGAEETGGSKTHALTTGELAAHNHAVGSNDSGTGPGGAAGNQEHVRDAGVGNGPATPTSTTGSGTAHNNVQPYIVVYMWKRTG